MTPETPEDADSDGDQLQRSQSAAEGAEESVEAPTDRSVEGDADADAVAGLQSELGSVLSDTYEEGAESFVELEADLLDDGPGPTGRVVGARTEPASTVPSDYPREVASEEVLVLELAVADDEVVEAYFAWPPGEGDALDRLLTALEIPRESFANLNGRRLVIQREDGYLLPVVPESLPRGSEYGREGILAGQAANLGLLAAAATGAISFPPLLLGLVFVNLFVLPIATFLDGWHLRTTTDWDHGPSFWAVLQSIPVVNLVVTAAYLWLRKRARPFSPD